MLEKKVIQMTTNKMDIPLFLSSRNRIRSYQRPRLQSHMKKYSHQLRAKCNIEYNMAKHETDFVKLNKKLDGEGRNLSVNCSHYPNAIRKYYEDFLWKIPPNIYHIDKEPFVSRKGQYGAVWTKSPRFRNLQKPYEFTYMKSKVTKSKKTSSYKSLQLDKSCNKYKYKYLGDNTLRDRYIFTINQRRSHRGTIERFNSTTYHQHQQELKKRSGRTPFEIYKDLAVSVKYNKLCEAYTEFSVGPGRYETRFRHFCPCPRNHIYHPNFNDLILNHLHSKWMGLKPKKIDLDKYCSPELMDVAGHGHCHLFKLKKSNVRKVQNVRKSETVSSLKREDQVGALKYILRMKSVPAKVDSNLSRKLPSLAPRIKYNIYITPMLRKTVSLKKSAFNSSLSRFPATGELRPRLSTSLKHVHTTLKRKSCLNILQITKQKFPHIKSTIGKLPQHLLLISSRHSHKPTLKFPDLPEPKILLFDEDIHKQVNKTDGFYSQPVDINEFLQTGVHLPDMSAS